MMFVVRAAAVEEHVDQLELLTNVFLTVTFVILLSSTNAEKHLEVLGTKLDTAQSSSLVAVIVSGLVGLFASTCWKIEALLRACDETEAPNAAAFVYAHKWLLNPFSYYGEGIGTLVNASLGTALLVFAWTMGMAALTLLGGQSEPLASKDTTAIAMTWVYRITGLAAAAGVSSVGWRLIRSSRITRHSTHRRTIIRRVIAARCIAAGLGGLLGWYFVHAFRKIGI